MNRTLSSCAKIAGRDLEWEAYTLPNRLGNQIRGVIKNFRQGVVSYKNPTMLELHTLTYLVSTTHRDWVVTLSPETARLEPRDEIGHQFAMRHKITVPKLEYYCHPLTLELESYIKQRIELDDLFLPGSIDETAGSQLDHSTPGRLLLLKKVMNKDYDPLFGITLDEAEEFPSHLVSYPLRRLKRDLNVCGFLDLGRRVDFLIKN